jgi:carboxyl-terminal processing protease
VRLGKCRLNDHQTPLTEHSATPERRNGHRWQAIGFTALRGAGIGLLLVATFMAGYFYRAHAAGARAAETDFSLLQEVEGVLANHYLYDLPGEAALVHGAAAGMVAALDDPYTYFTEPEATEIDQTNLAGSFGGIGAEITRNAQGEYVIHDVYRDNPAFEAGVEAGDIIVAVDGVPVDETAPTMNALLAAIRGEIGDPVTLTLRRDGDEFDVTIIRAEVLIPSTFWRVLEDDERIGYIQITRFTTRSPEEVHQAIEELQAQGVEAFVLDLRNNGGGLVDSAVKVSGEFMDGGAVLVEQRRGSDERVFNASRGGLAFDEPLAVLTNESTASAAEIVTGALQDRGRATVIGGQTFGKGSVQLIFDLSDHSSLHVTNAEWFTPDGRRIQGEGLAPDIAVEPEDEGDAPLRAAVDYLDEHLALADAN